MNFIITVLLLVTSLLSTGGYSEEKHMDIDKDSEVVEIVPGVVEEKYTEFGVELFKNSVKLDRGKNTCVSPMSVWTALAMTSNGAKGETLSQMESTLNMDVDSLNEYISEYMDYISKDENSKVKIANGIWFNTALGFQPDKEFLNTNSKYYDSEIRGEAFKPETKDVINSWVEENTMGMIKDILDKVDPLSIMYLVNALAFEAEWNKPYEDYYVEKGEFTKEDGTVQEVDMMTSDESIYIEDELASGFMKPYKEYDYYFLGLLPNEGVSLDEYVDSLDGGAINSILNSRGNTGFFGTVVVSLPKFESSYNIFMKDVLKDMGMKAPFDPGSADFSGLGTADDNIYISRVIHQTMVSVDEKSTKAAASTVVEMVVDSAPVEDIKELHFDRPFVYMIVDGKRNVPLFIGILRGLEE